MKISITIVYCAPGRSISIFILLHHSVFNYKSSEPDLLISVLYGWLIHDTSVHLRECAWRPGQWGTHYTKCLFQEIQFTNHTRYTFKVSSAVERTLLYPQSGSLHPASLPHQSYSQNSWDTCQDGFPLVGMDDTMELMGIALVHFWLLYTMPNNAIIDTPRQGLGSLLFLTLVVLFSCLFCLCWVAVM